MNKDDFIKMMEDGYKLLTREETLEEKSFRVGYEYAVDKMFYIVKNSDKEIENLHKIIDGMIDNEEEYCLENNRLNNIINELEKYLNEQIQKSWEIEEQCYEDIENKLQELKGDSNE